MFSDEHFLIWLKSKNLSVRTIKEYMWYLSKLKRDYRTFNQQVVDDFLSKKISRNGMARAFILNVKEFLDRDGVETTIFEKDLLLIHRIKIIKIKKKKPVRPNTITKKDVHLIEDVMYSEAARLMLLLSFYCGLRVSELLNLKIENFNWEEWKKDQTKNGKLIIKGKRDKIGLIPVKPIIMIRLMNWINENFDPETFDKSKRFFSISTVRWRQILSRDSIKALGRHVNPHLLRHSFAIHLVESGWDIMKIKEILRHEDISTTQIYASASPKQIDLDYYNI